jgi:hypothetical protein
MTAGFTFRETMAGPFALGESDPARGYERGKDTRSTLAMHATVTIDDMRAFVEDPEHVGQLAGTVDVSGMNRDIPAPSGVVRLFSPTGDAELKTMVYELAFEHEGRPFYLAGEKKVKDDPGIDIWKDTTTLYTRLHEGEDTAGPVAGAGILTLSPVELVKMVGTMRVLGGDALGQLETLSRFGRFFFGELWEAYAATKLRR